MTNKLWALSWMAVTMVGLCNAGNGTVPKTPAGQVITFDKTPYEKISDLIERRCIIGDQCMLVYWKLKKGALIPLHQHPNEQITYITDGKVEVQVNGRTVTIEKGGAILLPANTPHQFRALEDTIDLDVFTPIRSDWYDGSAQYLKKK